MKPYTRNLKNGDEGDDVKALQERLIQLGFKRTFLKDGTIGEIVPEGIFGDVTESSLASFQAKVIDAVSEELVPLSIRQQFPFEVDGTMDQADWFILEYYEELSSKYSASVKPDEIVVELPKEEESISEAIRKLAILKAKEKIGVVEEKPYNNSGRWVDEFQSVGSCGQISTGSPWCQYFMNWLVKKSAEELGVEYKWICNGYTPDNVNTGVKKGIGKKSASWSDIKVGAFGYIYSSSRGNAKHVFMIVGKNESNKTVTTIEGNTNPGGGSEGFGVFQRTRPASQVWAVVNWFELY